METWFIHWAGKRVFVLTEEILCLENLLQGDKDLTYTTLNFVTFKKIHFNYCASDGT